MYLKNQCHVCEHEYEFEMDDLTMKNGGSGVTEFGVCHWWYGEMSCPKCGEINGYGDQSQ